jgi:hypothetical protein
MSSIAAACPWMSPDRCRPAVAACPSICRSYRRLPWRSRRHHRRPGNGPRPPPRPRCPQPAARRPSGRRGLRQRRADPFRRRRPWRPADRPAAARHQLAGWRRRRVRPDPLHHRLRRPPRRLPQRQGQPQLAAQLRRPADHPGQLPAAGLPPLPRPGPMHPLPGQCPARDRPTLPPAAGPAADPGRAGYRRLAPPPCAVATNIRLHTRVRGCVLEPLWSGVIQMENACKQANNPGRNRRQPPTDDRWVRALPNMGCALGTADASSNATTTSVSAGQRLCEPPARIELATPSLPWMCSAD